MPTSSTSREEWLTNISDICNACCEDTGTELSLRPRCSFAATVAMEPLSCRRVGELIGRRVVGGPDGEYAWRLVT